MLGQLPLASEVGLHFVKQVHEEFEGKFHLVKISLGEVTFTGLHAHNQELEGELEQVILVEDEPHVGQNRFVLQ